MMNKENGETMAYHDQNGSSIKSDVSYNESYGEPANNMSLTASLPDFNLFGFDKMPGYDNSYEEAASAHDTPDKVNCNFMCELCPYNCNSRHNLLAHMTKSHPDAETYHCEKCPTFSSPFKSMYNKHITRHTMDRPYKCTVEGCDHACATKSGLQYHIKTHSSDKPYKCSKVGTF